MTNRPVNKETRDENLDALQRAVDDWYDREKARLENEVKFMRSVLEGRGAKEVAEINLATASILLQSEVDDFIVG